LEEDHHQESEEHMASLTDATAHCSATANATPAQSFIRRALEVAFAAALICSSLAACSASTTTAAAPGQGALTARTAPGKTPPGVHGEVHLTIWSVDSDGPDFQAILSGAIGDYGPAVTVLPNGKVDPEHTSQIELKLRHGTFRLYIDGIASKFRAQTAAHEPVYPATCSDYFNVSATVPVVAGSGTGAYQGIGGSFSLTLTDYEDETTPPCGPPLLAQILLLSGSGIVWS
jgi:hypothetical protein